MYGGFLVVQPSVIWQENLATINLLETVLLEEKSSDKLRVKTVYEARGVGRRRVRILLTWCGIEWRGLKREDWKIEARNGSWWRTV
ncbi:hypothetical protein KM043_014649 [Ampulex compressa]|nr:hypothetical protein KM043_014649 [Ampulex compressa]